MDKKHVKFMERHRLRKLKFPAFLALAAILRTAGALPADSIFSSLHLGVPAIAADARSRAMGGVSAALSGEDFSFSNPARTVNFWRSGINGVISQDYRTLKDGQGEAKLSSTKFMAFRGVFPAYKKFVVSWGIYKWRDLNWEYNDKLEADFLAEEFTRTLSSSGGLYISRLAVARTVMPHLALGLGLDWMIGKADRSRALDFQDSGLFDSKEEFNSRYSFFRPTFGLLASVGDVNLGLSVSTSTSADVDVTSNFTSSYKNKRTYSLTYPLSWRMGASWRPSRRSVVAADLEFEGWNESGLFLEPPLSAADQWRYSIGFELLPSAGENPSFYRKMPLRVGYSHTSYPYKVQGFQSTEKAVSFGSGMYFGRNNGLVDLAFEIAWRDSGAASFPEEKIFRIVLSLSAFERWVSRPRRK